MERYTVSLIGRLDLVKMSVVQMIFRFNAIPIECQQDIL